MAEAAGIKRKALAELPTPQPPASLAASYLASDEGAKRRMSPEPEANEVKTERLHDFHRLENNDLLQQNRCTCLYHGNGYVECI